MKFIKYCCLIAGLGLVMSACERDFVEYDSANEMRNDPFTKILVNTPVVSFVAGSENYTIDFLVITPNSDEVTSVDVYKTFTDSKTAETSSSVLLASYNVPAGQNTTRFTEQITFDELREGITIGGQPLTSNELDVAIGSSWVLTFDPVNSSGTTIFDAGSSINIGVLSPFAGIYEVIESDYYRIGAQSGAADWTGAQIFIGSVDDNTFSHNGWWGPFEAAGAFVFDLNDDNTLTVLDDPSQLFFSGDDMLTCQDDASSFQNVPCAGSNVLEPSEVDDAHIIKLTYGYFTDSGDENAGPREFYEVLRKID